MRVFSKRTTTTRNSYRIKWPTRRKEEREEKRGIRLPPEIPVPHLCSLYASCTSTEQAVLPHRMLNSYSSSFPPPISNIQCLDCLRARSLQSPRISFRSLLQKLFQTIFKISVYFQYSKQSIYKLETHLSGKFCTITNYRNE